MKNKKDPPVRCFDAVFGGGERPSRDRDGKTYWPHCINVQFRGGVDVRDVVMSGIRWLEKNGALPSSEREPFSIQTMGEVYETDPDTGERLDRSTEK